MQRFDDWLAEEAVNNKRINVELQNKIRTILADINGHWGFSIHKEPYPYILTGNKKIGQQAEKKLNKAGIVAKLRTHKGSYILAIDVDGDGEVDFTTNESSTDTLTNVYQTLGIMDINKDSKSWDVLWIIMAFWMEDINMHKAFRELNSRYKLHPLYRRIKQIYNKTGINHQTDIDLFWDFVRLYFPKREEEFLDDWMNYQSI